MANESFMLVKENCLAYSSYANTCAFRARAARSGILTLRLHEHEAPSSAGEDASVDELDDLFNRGNTERYGKTASTCSPVLDGP